MPSAGTLPPGLNGAKLRDMIGAVIYVRVSDPRQAKTLSLSTQLKVCEDYCAREGLQVLARFRESGESAKTADREELHKLVRYCRANKGRVHFVVVYNLTRFAWEKFDHFALRSLLKGLGISLRSATEPIDDTSIGKLMEGVLASFAQFDNDVRADRTKDGMRAALEAGRWTWQAPLGYVNAPRRMGASLIPDPANADLVRAAFEMFSTGRYTRSEVLAEMTRRGLRGRQGRTLGPQRFGMLLRNPLYIGVMNAAVFGIDGKRGDFDPLVSEKVFYRVQGLLRGRIAKATPHVRRRPDFPLRGFVRCATCGHALTGSWSAGRNSRYAYYHCWQKGCRRTKTSKAKLEGLFADELMRLQPTPGYMRLVSASILHVWRERKTTARRAKTDDKQRLDRIQAKMDRLDAAFLYEKSIDIETYDRQKEQLREEQAFARIDHHASELDEIDVEGILAFAERILPRAADLWVQASLDQRQRLQQLVFPEGITFDGNGFVGTAVTSFGFSYLGEIQTPGEGLASPAGFEPASPP